MQKDKEQKSIVLSKLNRSSIFIPKLLELRTATPTSSSHLVGGKLLVVSVVYVCMFC